MKMTNRVAGLGYLVISVLAVLSASPHIAAAQTPPPPTIPMPWLRGDTHTVNQFPGGTFSHNIASTLHAYDWLLSTDAGPDVEPGVVRASHVARVVGVANFITGSGGLSSSFCTAGKKWSGSPFSPPDPLAYFGNQVVIEDRTATRLNTRYLHLAFQPFSFNIGTTTNGIVTKGQWVAQGQILGREGTTGCSTGPHLHHSVGVGGNS